ncbi:MAG TPA: hypothetical protein VNH18_01630, partial [Bryobacteraceae bacterium]|nr:hypothetical protein [Bryobacteraceae bacterium]
MGDGMQWACKNRHCRKRFDISGVQDDGVFERVNPSRNPTAVQRSTWYFSLVGTDLDFLTLEDLFKGCPALIKFQGRLHMVIELPFISSEFHAAVGSAEELLSKLNGIAQAIHGNHENVRIGDVSCRESPSGPLNRLIVPGPARIRLRGLTPVVTTEQVSSSTPIQKGMGDRFLEVADLDEHFERALYLYGSLSQDWRGLYMVVEAAEDGNGGEKGLIAR